MIIEQKYEIVGYKTCPKCQCGHNNENDDRCFKCVAISLGQFWVSKKNHNVTMRSNGSQFVATIHAGVTGETPLSVGYSCPNSAWIEERMIPDIVSALDDFYSTVDELELEEMLPTLLSLCKTANSVYNRLLVG